MSLIIPAKIKCFLDINNISVKKIKKVKNGISNNVYFIKTINNDNFILKDYISSYNKTCKEKLLDNSRKNGITTLNIVCEYHDKNCDIEMYNYIHHSKIRLLKEKNVDLLINLINKIDIPLNSNFKYQDTIFQKVDNYLMQLEKLNKYKFDSSLIKDIVNRYKHLNITNKNELYIIHGDISITNVLWQKNSVALIDFDESIIAPKEYEYVSMLIKYCFNKGKFNKKLAKTFLKKIVNFNNIENIQKMLDFYILKVLIEKICLYEYDIIDLYDKKQKTDSWLYWYKLLNNPNLKIKNLI